jgi:hypothetical protein
MIVFTARKDFFSPETRSQYVNGLSYTARPDDRTLIGLLEKWLDEGKIELGGQISGVKGEG